MTAEELWRDFCRETGLPADTPHSAWAFGGAPDELAALTAVGIKTATASAYDLYALDPAEPLPKEGDLSVILDGDDNAVCVIRTTRLYISPFWNVTAEHAFKEGEGDRSLAWWRDVHRDFFQGELAPYGLAFSEDMRVLCEAFECLYPPMEGQDCPGEGPEK